VIEQPLPTLKGGKPTAGSGTSDLDAFEEIVGMPEWGWSRRSSARAVAARDLLIGRGGRLTAEPLPRVLP
jgi:hypothetical protein